MAELAGCLRELEAAESALTAARAGVLWAFRAANGPADDGHGSAGTWVRWQTRVTDGAASGAVAWARRLHAHPAIAQALASGQLSASWARALCGWSDLLPEGTRSRADQILADAAVAGAELADLAALAAEIRCRTAGPDRDEPSDGFAGRGLRLGVTFGGAGRLEADLSASCTAALSAVLDALGKKAGPEDIRTRRQRRHDALEEACRRLVTAGCLPGWAGQPTRIQLHMTLDQLRHLPSPPGGGVPLSPPPGPAWWPAAPPGADCDAAIIPVVSGHLDTELLEFLIRPLKDPANRAAGREPVPEPDRSTRPSRPGTGPCPAGPPAGHPAGPPSPAPGRAADRPPSGVAGPPGRPGSGYAPLAGSIQTGDHPLLNSRTRTQAGAARDQLGCNWARTQAGAAGQRPGREREQRAGQAERDLILNRALDLLSGPSGLAAWLRTSRLDGIAASASLPLDTGAATDTIPAHLRRAVTTRDQHCRFPGCTEPPAACQIHHVIPRRHGGPTRLRNLALLCAFHHLIAVHRWGWALTLHPDGEVTATSPDGSRIHRTRQPPAGFDEVQPGQARAGQGSAS